MMAESDEPKPSTLLEGPQPLPIAVYWIVLLIAVTGVSSAGSMFQQVDDVPPVLRASWRLQVTSLILFPPAVVQWMQADQQLRSRIAEKKNLGILFASGCFVGAHFAAWVASLDLTTLTHSLLFVTAHPLVVVAGMWVLHHVYQPVIVPSLHYLASTYGATTATAVALEEGHEKEEERERERERKDDAVGMTLELETIPAAVKGSLEAGAGAEVEVEEWKRDEAEQEEQEEEEEDDGRLVQTRLPPAQLLLLPHLPQQVRCPNLLELGGAVLGFIGAGVTFLDVGATQGDRRVTVAGNMFAFLGAVLLVLYLACGRVLRAWMPLFIYAFPVTLIGALVILPVSAGIESDSLGTLGVVGWHASSTYLQWFFALALIAGLCGHTGMNMCLARISPLVVCTAATSEPVIGSLIGWAVFDSGAPSTWTYIGGTILLSGIVLVVIGAPPDTMEEDNKGGVTEKVDAAGQQEA